jgi:hypothetical protein
LRATLVSRIQCKYAFREPVRFIPGGANIRLMALGIVHPPCGPLRRRIPGHQEAFEEGRVGLSEQKLSDHNLSLRVVSGPSLDRPLPPLALRDISGQCRPVTGHCPRILVERLLSISANACSRPKADIRAMFTESRFSVLNSRNILWHITVIPRPGRGRMVNSCSAVRPWADRPSYPLRERFQQIVDSSSARDREYDPPDRPRAHAGRPVLGTPSRRSRGLQRDRGYCTPRGAVAANYSPGSGPRRSLCAARKGR